MGFAPRLPTFNQSVTLHRFQGGGVWLPDPLPASCQVYTPLRVMYNVVVQDIYTTRNYPGFDYHEQVSSFYIYFLFPVAVNVRDPVDVWLAIGTAPEQRDFLTYTNPHHGPREYWIDWVEPRWAGFSNEHKIAACCRKWTYNA